MRDRLNRIEPQQDDVDLFGRYAQHLDPEAFEGVLAFAVARGMSVISLLNHWQRWRQERDLGRAGTPLS